MNSACQGDYISFNIVEGLLHMDEEASDSWEGESHGEDIPNNLVPLSDTNSILDIAMPVKIPRRQNFLCWERDSVILNVYTK